MTETAELEVLKDLSEDEELDQQVDGGLALPGSPKFVELTMPRIKRKTSTRIAREAASPLPADSSSGSAGAAGTERADDAVVSAEAVCEGAGVAGQSDTGVTTGVGNAGVDVYGQAAVAGVSGAGVTAGAVSIDGQAEAAGVSGAQLTGAGDAEDVEESDIAMASDATGAGDGAALGDEESDIIMVSDATGAGDAAALEDAGLGAGAQVAGASDAAISADGQAETADVAGATAPIDEAEMIVIGDAPNHDEVQRLLWKHCTVCNKEMGKEDIHALECGHRFHVSCIIAMSESGWNRCAVCLQEISDRAQPQPEMPEEKQCAVCMLEVAVGNEHSLNCGHKCHLECIASMTELGWDGCTACPTTSAVANEAYLDAVREMEEELGLDRMTNYSLAARNGQYLQLMHLDFSGLVLNKNQFECPVCFTEQAAGDGAVLKDCLHTFCKACLAQTIEYSEDAEVKCPYQDANYSCQSVLQQREIKALVPQHVFEQHLARGVSQAENRMQNAFHCKTPDCVGWCVRDEGVKEFWCQVCNHANCLSCQAIHEGIDCRTYQDERNPDVLQSIAVLQTMVETRVAMACPTCKAVVEKITGCDRIVCTFCGTDLCWATRGPRWGPGGKGDTSGGCQCNINGQRCHPSCRNCH